MATKINKLNYDHVWIIASIVSGAIEPILLKYGYRGEVTPVQIFFVRNVIAVFLVLPCLWQLTTVAKQQNLAHRLNQASAKIGKVLPMGFLFTLTAYCSFISLKYMSAVVFITVVTTTPAVVAVLNQKLKRDTLGKTFWLGFGMCFLGVLLSLDWSAFSTSSIGVLCSLIAVLSSSIYRVSMESITEEFSPSLITAICFGVSGGISYVIGASSISSIPSYSWGLGLLIGCSAVLANIAFLKALKRIGSTRISLVTMLQRPLFIIFAALVLREQPTIVQWIGIALVTIGMHYAKVTHERIAHARDITAPQIVSLLKE